MDKKILELLKNLPSITACIVWDVLNDNITLKTIELANDATDQEWDTYDIVRCIAAGNPAYPPTTEAKMLVEMMITEIDFRPTSV